MYQKETPVGKREQQRATTFIPVVCKYVVDLFAVPLPFYLVVYTCISEETLSSERATRKGKMEDEERERERERCTPVVSKAISTMAVSVSEAARWNTENMFFQPDLQVYKTRGKETEFVLMYYPASHAICINTASTPVS